MRLLTGILVVVCAACAGVFAGAALAPPTETSTASAQARAYFAQMQYAHDSTGVEQAACVSDWTLRMRYGKPSFHIERVREAFNVRAYRDSVHFACYATEATVHTHDWLCLPSAEDRRGNEVFGVVVCQGARFAVFAVRPKVP